MLMSVFRGFLGFVVMLLLATIGVSGSSSWTAWGSSEYYFISSTSAIARQEAVSRCSGVNARLVSIESSSEMLHVNGLKVHGYVWIDRQDSEQEGVWKDWRGCPVTFTSWAGTEPNNGVNGNAAIVDTGMHDINHGGEGIVCDTVCERELGSTAVKFSLAAAGVGYSDADPGVDRVVTDGKERVDCAEQCTEIGCRCFVFNQQTKECGLLRELIDHNYAATRNGDMFCRPCP